MNSFSDLSEKGELSINLEIPKVYSDENIKANQQTEIKKW